MKNSNGFTLVELLIVVMIMVIIMALGAPSFNSLIQGSRLTSTANNISLALNVARSEAIKLGIQIDIVPASSNWSQAITVERSDDNADIRVFPAVTGSITITESGGLTSLSYLPNGRSNAAATFIVCDSGRTGETGRSVNVTSTGRISVAEYTCS